MKKKSAFTLIELLVVVAIIGILAALLFPALKSFLEKGRATDDANNLASLGKTISIYMTDSKGTFFAADAAGDDTWPKVLNRNYFSKDWRPFRSPFDLVTDARPKNKDGTDPVPVSYGLNENLFDTYDGKWKAPPSSLVLAACAIMPNDTGKIIHFKTDAFSTSNIKLATGTGNGTLQTNGSGTFENRQKQNVLFCDYHVSPLDDNRYQDGTSERGKMQWHPDYEKDSN